MEERCVEERCGGKGWRRGVEERIGDRVEERLYSCHIQ